MEFDKSQINLLKQIHSDAFNESNPYNEAKEVVGLFKEKARVVDMDVEEVYNIQLVLLNTILYRKT